MNSLEVVLLIIVLIAFCVSYLLNTFTNKNTKKKMFNKLHSNHLVNIHPEFDKIYKEIENNSLFLEVNRYKNKTESSLICSSLFFIVILFILLLEKNTNPILVILLFLIYFIFLITVVGSYYNKYILLHKTTIILPLVEKISKTLKYTHDDGSPTEPAYKASNLETSFFNKYISDDYMYGSINGYNFNLSNIHTQHVKESDIGKLITHLFNGIFIYSYTDTGINFDFKFLNKKLMYASANFEVSVPDIRFTKHFRLYAENQDAVLDIFNDELLNLLDNFMNNYGVPFDLSVSKDAFYFRFYTGTSFEASLFKAPNYLYTLNIYYCIITFVIEFMSTFQKYNKKS